MAAAAFKASKQPAKAAAKSGSNRDARVDELGELLEWAAENKDKIKRIEELKKALAAEIAEGAYKPDEQVTREGDAFVLTWGLRTQEVSVTDVKMAHKLMGDEVFYGVAKVSVKAITDYLTPEQRKKCTTTGLTGSRSLKGSSRRNAA